VRTSVRKIHRVSTGFARGIASKIGRPTIDQATENRAKHLRMMDFLIVRLGLLFRWSRCIWPAAVRIAFEWTLCDRFTRAKPLQLMIASERTGLEFSLGQMFLFGLRPPIAPRLGNGLDV
jgi:hypothetical protein